jgi:hypothetical protein
MDLWEGPGMNLAHLPSHAKAVRWARAFRGICSILRGAEGFNINLRKMRCNVIFRLRQ